MKIKVAFVDNPIRGFEVAVRLAEEAPEGAWGGVKRLELGIEPVDTYYEVRGISLATMNWNSAVRALHGQLLATYARQLHGLSSVDGVALLESMASFEQLRSVDICYDQIADDALLRICPDHLESLVVRGLPANHRWPAPGGSDTAGRVVFPRLRSLGLIYTRASADASIQRQGRRAWAVEVHLPKLEHFWLVCRGGACPFLEVAQLPPVVDSMDVTASAGVLESVARLPIAVARSITVTLDADRTPDALPLVSRIMERAQRGCARKALNVNGPPPAGIECAALTHLCVDTPMSVQAAIELIQRLPSLFGLRLKNVVVGTTVLPLDVPPGPGERAPAPLSTSLRDLAVRFDWREPFFKPMIAATQHLLLRTPALATFASNVPPRYPMADFVGACTEQCPNLARLVFARYRR
ncbi:hypothetical protein H4R18_003660 [Coemansia javaensis]|uniref:Uncharacterized protein n=1 Tax=Coemansia javaensis TaxID=2761396 RepID=A0A9W8H770_9FUNG|nr:hypothetical protein H4R18_003660 [Coemansia javaensis]